ncbi:Rap family tetratricopeptide repeat protein [Bacillus swezeyi]|uniref:Tetratricopeptide repeat protein n=1 Tax=Bacillus swezeyi TaxID=1925020 RepID=A0A5M8S507_9BACI|nr:Rap family tetratricopeptide repeat protein [Bacillus swezeyi]KAA6453242.1 tetratricopeptide repeat protein [Bacillus swezeyi]TYS38612.1 tetratricopeptide repeat protein [Bacillus swezeyi]
MSKVASEIVAGILNELHLAIKKQEADQATKLFHQAKSMFDGMEENQNVLLYFSLLEERYKMMLYDIKGERLPYRSRFNDDSLEYARQTDHMIDFYFYFFEAMYESYNKNFERAISLYKVAEKKLSKIPDEIEAAEFYSKVASLYMSLRQSVVSLNYINQAINIYKGHKGYEKKLAISMVVMATNYMHMGRYNDAEAYYDRAISISKELNDHFLEVMLHHNVSIVYSVAGRPHDCINALKKPLSNESWCSSGYLINSIYMITRELFKIGKNNEAHIYYQKGLKELKRRENKIYEAKLNIVYELYSKNTSESIDNCRSYLHYLIERNDLDGAIELSLIISKHYEENEDYQEALEFAKKAIQAENKMKRLEGI